MLIQNKDWYILVLTNKDNHPVNNMLTLFSYCIEHLLNLLAQSDSLHPLCSVHISPPFKNVRLRIAYKER
jgi:hypothetical protein